jgi:hypothetical protein
VGKGLLEKAAEMLFCDARTFGKFPELQGVVGICLENRTHQIQRCADLLRQSVCHA